jgi:hypothetical protein
MGFQHLDPTRHRQITQQSQAAQRVRLTASFVDRFWARVVRRSEVECWNWTGRLNEDGYGPVNRLGERTKAHVVAYKLIKGEPRGLHVLHTCDNRACCNPSHMFLGTNLDNVRDKVNKGRQHRISGEANVRAKLTTQDVLAIRASAEKGVVLANRYGVTSVLISRIRLRKAWRHI